MFSNKDNMTEVMSISSIVSEDMRITGIVIANGEVVCAGQNGGTIACDNSLISSREI